MLKKLSEQEGISQKQLAIKLDKDQNTVKAIIDKLEKNGFVIRLQNPNDKRAFTLFLTEKAKRLLPLFMEIDKECMQKLCENLSLKEISLLSELLAAMRKNLN